MRKKIVFDNIIFSLQKMGGISVVWYELLKRLTNQPDVDLQCIEYCSAHDNFLRKKIQIKNLINKNLRFLWFERYLNIKLKETEKFIFHSSYYRTCKNRNAINITTVHDFTYEKFSKGLKKMVHSCQKKRAVKNSEVVICISENTKKDLLNFIPDVDPQKVIVIYNGISEDYFQLTNYPSAISPYESQSYLLFVGARDKYKNFDIVLDLINNSDYNLIVVGNEFNNDEKSFIISNKLDNRICNLGRINSNDLNFLYNDAFALIYPSSYEGFGIPVIEAQKAGCPVIAYKSSSIPEIIGDTRTLIDNLSYKEILTKLSMLKDRTFRDEIVTNGLNNSKRFTWEKTYEELLKVYQSVFK